MEEVAKKAWYKKWWVWVLIVFFGPTVIMIPVSIIMALTGNLPETPAVSTKVNEEVKKEKVEAEKGEVKYTHLLGDTDRSGINEVRQDWWIAKDKDLEAMHKFADGMFSDQYFLQYVIFVDDPKYAKLPKYPITTLDFPTEQAKHIIAIYERKQNSEKGIWRTYTGKDDWKNLASTDIIEEGMKQGKYR